MKGIIYLFCIAIFTSCVITKTPGFYVGYENLSPEETDSVVFVDRQSAICDLTNNNIVYSINGKQLRDCLKENDTSIIYRWGPNCSSSNCPLIIACQEYCTKRNYDLYVIAEYYNIEEMAIQNIANKPIFIANHQFYGRRYANKLNRFFIEDLLNGEKLQKEDRYNRFLVFKGDKLISTHNNLFQQ